MKTLVLAAALSMCVRPASAQVVLTQTDTAEASSWSPGVGCFSTSNASMKQRLATTGGTAGVTANSITTGASAVSEAAITFRSGTGVPNSTSWASGNATFRLEVTTSAMNVTWNNIQYDYWQELDSTPHQLNCLGISVSIGSTGVKTSTQAVSASAGRSSNDKIEVAYGFANSGSAATWGFKPSQNIDTPVIQVPTASCGRLLLGVGCEDWAGAVFSRLLR